jgi:hypothetical protein
MVCEMNEKREKVMFKKVMVLVITTCILCSSFLSVTVSGAGGPGEFYVSVNGSDENGNGTFNNPWRTIQKAADVMEAGDTCYIRAGTYRETVTPACSGSDGNPITFKAYSGDIVTVNGTEEVSGEWSQYNGSIYRIQTNMDLSQDNQLFIDGKMAFLSQYPNDSDDDPFTLETKSATGGSATTLTDTSLTGTADDYVGAKLYVNGADLWEWQSATVTGYNAATHTLTFSGDTGYDSSSEMNPVQGSPYYLAGKLNFLDTANEWYYDSTEHYLYLQVEGGGNPSGKKVEIKKRNLAFNLSNKSYINIENINIFASAIDGLDANHCIVKKVNAKYLNHSSQLCLSYNEIYDGSKGLGISFVNGDYNTIRDCDIEYSCFTSVFIRGKYNNVVNNYIKKSNYSGANGAGVFMTGQYDLVANNTIEKAGRLALLDWAQKSEIKYNIIHGALMNDTNDYGVVCLCQQDYGNTVIHHNIIYDNMGQTWSGGLYTDDYSSNLIMHHNIIWNACGRELFTKGGDDNCLIYNNTIIGNGAYNDDGNRNTYNTRYVNNIFTGSLSHGADAYVSSNITGSTDLRFTDPGNHDYTLQSVSPAIDAGQVIPGVTDGYSGNAPDIGAFEYGQSDWTLNAGHNFENPPTPSLSSPDFQFMNEAENGGFQARSALADDLMGWTKTGSNNAAVVDSCLRPGEYGLSLRLGGGVDGIEQTVTGLNPDTTYTLSGWLKADSGETVRLGVEGFGGNEKYQESCSTVSNRYKLTFKTGATDTSATIYINKTSAGLGYVYADDISLVEKAGDSTVILDEQWNSIAGWNTQRGGTIEINPAGQLHLSDNTNSFTLVNKQISDGLPDSYTVEFKAKVDDFGAGYNAVSRTLFLETGNETNRLRLSIESNGIYVIDSTSSVRKQSMTMDNQWHVYKVKVDSGYADLYMDGAYLFTYSMERISVTNGFIQFGTLSANSDTTEAHVDYLKIYTEKISPKLDERWDSLAGWNTEAGGTIEINPAGQLHLKDNTNSFTLVSKQIADGLADSYTVEFKAKVDDFGTGYNAVSRSLSLEIGNAMHRLRFSIENDGIYYADNTPSIKKYSMTMDHQWHVYKVKVDSGYAELYMDGTYQFTYSMEDVSVTNGLVLFYTMSANGDATEAHVDYVKLYTDMTAPILTAKTTTRISDTEAVVKFTSNEAGQYYYAVVADGAAEPVIDTSGTGTASMVGETDINLTDLSTGAKDIYIKVKDASGNVSSALKMDINVPILDEQWNSLAGWNTERGGTIEINPAGQLHLSDNTNSFTLVNKQISGGLPDSYTVEFKAKVDDFGAGYDAVSRSLFLEVGNEMHRLRLVIENNGIYYADNTPSIKNYSMTVDHQWHVYKVKVDSGHADLYMDGLYLFTYNMEEISVTNGLVQLGTLSANSDTTEAHVDYIKLYTEK